MAPPVLVGVGQASGQLLVIERLDEAQPTFFGRDDDGTLQPLTVHPWQFQSDGETSRRSFFAASAYFSTCEVVTPLVPGEGGLALGYSSASVDLELGATSDGPHVDSLEGLEDCQSALTPLSPVESWWGPEIIATSPATGDWIYLVELLAFAGEQPADQFFAFYGPAEEVRQRKVLSYSRAKDGLTRFSIDIEGRTAFFEFPAGCEDSPISRECPGVLTLDNATVELESRWSSREQDLGELAFECQYVVAP